MTQFDERERAFEAKFVHDEEMLFRADARRTRLAGLWAAALLGKSGPAAEDYAREVMRSEFRAAGHDEVLAKLTADLAGMETPQAVRAKLAELLDLARAQVMAEE